MFKGGISEDLERAKNALNNGSPLSELKKRQKKKRIDFLLKKNPDLITWSDLERNWYLWEINKLVNLGICRFFHFSENSGKQYCIPTYEERDVAKIILRMNGVCHCFEISECCCNLLEVKGGCKKEKIFKS